MDTPGRLLRLLSLLPARREWSGQELAERLSVTPRTVRRDIQRLRDLGYPIAATPGVSGGYRLGAGGSLPPLLLDDEEAVAVAVGLRTAAGGTVAGMEESSVRALAKLEQVLPVRLRQRVAAVQSATVALVATGPAVDPDVLVQLAAACRDEHRLRFAYRRQPDAEPRIRLVEPHRLVHTGRRWYLVARDVDRDDWRTYRVDRIEPPITTGGRFTPKDPPDAASFVSEQVASAPYPYRARIRFTQDPSAIRAMIPPTVGHIEELPDGGCVLATGAYSLEALAVHIASLNVDFVVEEPAELVDVMRVLARRLAQYSGAQ